MKKSYAEKIQQREVNYLEEKLKSMSLAHRKSYLRGYLDKIKYEIIISTKTNSREKLNLAAFGWYLSKNHTLTDYLLETMKNLNMRKETKQLLDAKENCSRFVDKLTGDLTKDLGKELKLPTDKETRKFHELEDLFP